MAFNKTAAHIVYASDDNFAEIMGVSMVSLFENSRDMLDIVIYILDSGVSEENHRKIEEICDKYDRCRPHWIKAKNISKELNINVDIDRGSLSQYARLFISSTLPADLERVLYLDCDIIINKSISELWQLDMKGRTIAALGDAFSKYYRANIGLAPNDVMFNSGIMLIDLVKWKQQNIEKKLLKFIVDRKGHIQQGDQGALNAILSKDTYCFEPRFNSVTIFYDFNYDEMMIYRKPPSFYSREEVRKATEEPVIIHFTTSFLSERPWVKGCRHRYRDRWIYFRKKSPWADCPLREPKKSKGISGLYTKIIHKLPRRIAIGISGILQAYGRPLMNKIKGF